MKSGIEGNFNMLKNDFLNSELLFDIPKINSIEKIHISKNYDANLNYPYIIDIGDIGYFYANKVDRDSDYVKLKSYIKVIENKEKLR